MDMVLILLDFAPIQLTTQPVHRECNRAIYILCTFFYILWVQMYGLDSVITRAQFL